MALTQSSTILSQSCEHWPQASESPQPRLRSESIVLPDQRGRVKNEFPSKCDDWPGHETDAIRVFSRSADEWVDGEVKGFVDDSRVWVEYDVGELHCGKTMHLASEHLVNLAELSESKHEPHRRLCLCPASLSQTSSKGSSGEDAFGYKSSQLERSAHLPSTDPNQHIWTFAGALKCSQWSRSTVDCMQGVKAGDKVNSAQLQWLLLEPLFLQDLLDRHWIERDCFEVWEDPLDYYLRNPSTRPVPDGYSKEGDLLLHLATGVVVWGQVLAPLAKLNILGGDLVLYHYSSEAAFWAIVHSGDLQASTRLSTDCDFGVGQYATKKQPHMFRAIRDILYNNYPRATSSHNPADPSFPKEERASHCIPLLVQRKWTPAFPLTNPNGQRGAVCETKDRYGIFDSQQHDIWIVDVRVAERGFAVGGAKDQRLVAFFKAAEQGQTDIIKLHLQHGVKVNRVGRTGGTALHEAASNGHTDTVRELLSAMAEVNVKIIEVKRSLLNGLIGFVQRQFRCWRCRTQEKKHPTQITFQDCRSVSTIYFQDRCKMKAGLKRVGSTALHEAACNGHMDTVRELLSAMAAVNALSVDSMTPLRIAQFGDSPEHHSTVKLLLSANADPLLGPLIY